MIRLRAPVAVASRERPWRAGPAREHLLRGLVHHEVLVVRLGKGHWWHHSRSAGGAIQLRMHISCAVHAWRTRLLKDRTRHKHGARRGHYDNGGLAWEWYHVMVR